VPPSDPVPEVGRTGSEEPRRNGDGRGLTTYYAALLAFTVVGIAASLAIGSGKEAEQSYSGRYEVVPRSECLGRTFDLRQSGQFASVSSPDSEVDGSLRVDEGRITGDVKCIDSSERVVDLKASPTSIRGMVGAERIDAARISDEPPPEAQLSVRPGSVDGNYELAPLSACLGSQITLDGESDELKLDGAGPVKGSVSYESGRVSGQVTCLDGSVTLIEGEATASEIQIALTAPAGSREGTEDELLEAIETPDLSSTVASFLVALIVIILVARAFGAAAVVLRQPRVMGEVVAGLVLGPTVLGAIAPELTATLFPSELIVILGVFANLGVVLYMFMIGVEVDLSQMRRRLSQAFAVATGSFAIPMVLGVAIAVPTFALVGPDVRFTEFALFMGVAMSITAFPVLARILAERGMLQRSIGTTALAAAAIGDAFAWFLIALATAFATSTTGADVALTIILAVVFCAVMFGAVRPLLARAFARRGGTRISAGWLSTVLAAVLLSAYVSETIGVAVIFGAFVMGLVMPRTRLTEDAVSRIEDFVVLVLLPLFFVYTGLRTNVGLLNDSELWVLTAVLLGVAIAGKFAGAMIGARVSGLDMRRSAMLGTMMNTRGLTELIALNLALDLGVISEALFTSLVLMALITTFMAGPLLNLLDPRRKPGAEPSPDGPMPGGASA